MADEYLTPFERNKLRGGGRGTKMRLPDKNISTFNTATGQKNVVPQKFNTVTGKGSAVSKADVLAGEPAYLGGGDLGGAPTVQNQFMSPFDRNRSAFDTQNFDVNDPEQVANFQKMFMGMKEGDAGWGMMGPKTTKRFQDYVNQSRMTGGMDAYTYEGSMNQNAADLLNQEQLLNLTGDDWKPDPEKVQEKVLTTNYGDDTSFRDQNVWQNIGDAAGQTFEDIGSTVSNYWNSMWGGDK